MFPSLTSSFTDFILAVTYLFSFALFTCFFFPCVSTSSCFWGLVMLMSLYLCLLSALPCVDNILLCSFYIRHLFCFRPFLRFRLLGDQRLRHVLPLLAALPFFYGFHLCGNLVSPFFFFPHHLYCVPSFPRVRCSLSLRSRLAALSRFSPLLTASPAWITFSCFFFSLSLSFVHVLLFCFYFSLML